MATTKASDDVDAGKLAIEPNWLTGDLGNYSALEVEKLHLNEEHIYQQSDLIKPMMDDIVKFGLNYTYQKFKGVITLLHGYIAIYSYIYIYIYI